MELISSCVNIYKPASSNSPCKENPITILVSALYSTVKLFSSASPPKTFNNEMPSNPNWNPARGVLESIIISTSPSE